VPGLVFGVDGDTVELHIRGVGSNNNDAGNELPVAVYIDGVYLAAANENLMSLSDVSRIEVLKGPQGTQFGRNATGAVINILTQDPTQGSELNLRTSVDNFLTSRTDLFASTGIIQDLAATFSGEAATQGKGGGGNYGTGDDIRQVPKDITARTQVQPYCRCGGWSA
jgi:iron complex outermembrane receptor protein